MGILDEQPLDQPLEEGAYGTQPLSTPPKPAADHSRLIIPLLIIALLGGGFFGVRWWLARRAATTPQPAAALPQQPGTEAIEPRAQPVNLPPMDQMDPFLRQLLGALSARPELARWLATDDVTQRIVFTVDQVARGNAPTKENRSIAPSGRFETTTRGRQRSVDPNTYRRYDGLAATASSVDPAAVAKAYATIKPRLDEAYRQMGHPDGDFDRILHQAIATLIETPVVEQPPALVQSTRGLNWAYADRNLETLQPAQKQLLRMGPDNQRAVQTKLREIEQALKQSNTR